MITCHVSSIIVRLACAGNFNTWRKLIARWAAPASVLASLLFAPPASFAHSDTLDGPVVAAARKALDSGDVNPVLMLSITSGGSSPIMLNMDTAANILATGEFVVHLSDEAMGQRMHDCGHTFPPDVSEVAEVGLSTVPSLTVRPPRIAEAPVAFECVLHEKMETDSRYVFFGRVQWLAARAGLVDTEAWRVNLREYTPVARFGASFYIRCGDRFAMAEGTGAGGSRAASTRTAIDGL